MPFLNMHGFSVDGLRFDWDDSVEYTPAEQTAIETMLVNGGYEIESKYWVEKYNIPVTGKRDPAPSNFFRITPGGTRGLHSAINVPRPPRP